MISQISFSSLSMALRCGEQFRRRYMLGQIIPPNIPAGTGRGMHKAVEVNFQQKRLTKQDMPLPDMLDAARDGYVHTFQKDGVYLTKEEQSQKEKLLNEGLKSAIRLTKLHREKVAPTIQPKRVEERFVIDVGIGLPFMGYIDLITAAGEIVDHKTAGKSWPKGKIKKDMQPVFYTMAYKEMLATDTPAPFKFYIHVNLKEPKVQIQEHTVEKWQEAALIERARVVIDMINKGVFLPANPGDWWCSPAW